MFQSHANQPHSPPWSSVGINIETNKTLDTTGGHLWDAAKRLFEFMENEQETYDLSRDGLRMLELGSGTGWLGIALAMNLHNADSIVTTEQDGGGAMEYLERNVENHKYFLKNPSVLTAHSLDWSRILDSSTANLENELNESAYDIVFGSDLLYNLDGVEMLPKVMAAFCATGATVLYAHTFNRYEFLDADFFFALRRQGLICREVWSSSDVPPEFTPTDERFCNVFPEARIAILDIRVLRKQDPALVRKYALVKTTPDITAMPTGGQQVGADATTSTPTPTFESMHTVEGIYTETDATLNALHEEIVLYLMDKVDLPAVVNLRATSRNNHFSNIFPENWLACHDFNTLMYDVWSKNLTSPTRLTIGARDAFGQLIGFVHTDTRNYVHENFGLCIDDIHVASPGAGLGRKLFKALVRRLAMAGNGVRIHSCKQAFESSEKYKCTCEFSPTAANTIINRYMESMPPTADACHNYASKRHYLPSAICGSHLGFYIEVLGLSHIPLYLWVLESNDVARNAYARWGGVEKDRTTVHKMFFGHTLALHEGEDDPVVVRVAWKVANIS